MIRKYELLSTAVASMYHDIQKIERVEMAKFGLKGPHAQCLLAMARNPQGVTAAHLCRICEKDKAAISRSVTEMEQQGLLTRSQQGGRYRALLMLTEKGQTAARSVDTRARQAVEQAGEGLEDGQREIFYRVLGQIAENLHGICRTGIQDG